MRKFLYISLLFFSTKGFAVNWEKVLVDKSGDSYYVQIIKMDKYGHLYYVVLGNFLKPFQGNYSSKKYYKVDCDTGKTTWLKYSYHTQPMGRGKMTIKKDVNETEFLGPRKKNTYRYKQMRYACDTAFD